MRPVPGYASCSRSAWPPIRFVGYRRFFGLRASIAVSSVAYQPYRVCVTVIQDRSVYRLPVHFQLLSTPPRGDAVTFSFLAGSSAREGLAPSCARLFSSARPQPSGCISALCPSVSIFSNALSHRTQVANIFWRSNARGDIARNVVRMPKRAEARAPKRFKSGAARMRCFGGCTRALPPS